jgi:hypothetical protein
LAQTEAGWGQEMALLQESGWGQINMLENMTDKIGCESTALLISLKLATLTVFFEIMTVALPFIKIEEKNTSKTNYKNPNQNMGNTKKHTH